MTNAEPSANGAPAADQSDLGGDPVCWLHLVCPECGRFAADDGDWCSECGAELSP